MHTLGQTEPRHGPRILGPCGPWGSEPDPTFPTVLPSWAEPIEIPHPLRPEFRPEVWC